MVGMQGSSVSLALCLRRGPSRLLVAAMILAIAASVIPMLLWLTRNLDGSKYYYWYGFQDRRWIVSLYFIWVVGLPLLILILARIARIPTKPVQIATNTTIFAKSRFGLIKRGILFLGLGSLAWIQSGPPWGGPAMHGVVDIHETVHLKGYQGILKGAQPYIGAGGEQYGPLSQLFVSEWSQRASGVSLSGIREAYAAQNFMAVLFIILILVVFLRPKVAFFAVIAGCFLGPHFADFTQTIDGTVGFFGWWNLWRYAGVLLLGLGIPWLLSQSRSPQRRVQIGFLVGLLWGLTTMFAQENLLGGILVAVILLVAVIVARITTARVAVATVSSLFIALTCVWVGYLLPYVLNGTAGDFITNYFLFPSAVTAGYTGSSWAAESPWTAFYVLAPALVCLGGVTLSLARCRETTETVKVSGAQRSVIPAWLSALGLFAASAVAYAAVLNRSDESHLANSSWLFPFFVVVFMAWALEQQRTSPGGVVTIAIVAIPMVSLIIVGIGSRSIMPIYPSLEKFGSALASRVEGVSNPLFPPSGRIDAPLDPLDPALGIGQDVSRQEAERFSADLKSLAGERPTYIDSSVSGSFGALTTGYWYFAADLHPVELPFEEDHMEISTHERDQNLKALSDPENPIEVLITSDPHTEKSTVVLQRGGYNLLGQLLLKGHPVQVYVRS